MGQLKSAVSNLWNINNYSSITACITIVVILLHFFFALVVSYDLIVYVVF
jgi:hypothetical protein